MKKILTFHEVQLLFPDHKIAETTDRYEVHLSLESHSDMVVTFPKEMYFLGKHMLNPLIFATDYDGRITRALPFDPDGLIVHYLPGKLRVGDDYLDYFDLTQTLDETTHLLIAVEWDRRIDWMRIGQPDREPPMVRFTRHRVTESDPDIGQIAGIDFYAVDVTCMLAENLSFYFYQRELLYQAAADAPAFDFQPPVTGWDNP